MQRKNTAARVEFGLFEVDLTSGEIWRGGFRIKLQSQPFRVLAELIRRPGQVVTREELQELVWGRDTNIDFDHSLGTAINKIREALSDSAENPKFVETLTRRGYRFIAPVRSLESEKQELSGIPANDRPLSTGPSEEVALAATADSEAPLGDAANSRWGSGWLHTWWFRVAAIVVAALLFVGSFLLGRRNAIVYVLPMRQITHGADILPGGYALEFFPAAVTDGPNIYASAIYQGGVELRRFNIPTPGDEAVHLPNEVAGPTLADISHSGSRLLIRSRASNESEQPLFIVPVAGGSAQRVPRVLAHDATWMPDDSAILYANGNDLYIARLDNSAPEHYATLQGRPFWLRWSPDGKLLRFTLFDPLAHTQSLWEMQAANRKARPLLQGWNQPHEECCGVWTADSSSYIFQAAHGARSDLWRLRDGVLQPERLTNGPLAYGSAATSRTGQTVYFSGVDNQGQIELLDMGRSELLPAHSFFSDAHRLDVSRDGKWLAWVDVDGHLWRARTDGSELLQLTPADLEVFTARWSPDHSRLAIMARAASSAWSIYQVLADGSDLQPFLQTEGNTADPGWSPDGQTVVFGRAPDLMGKDNAPRVIQTLDLRTHRIDTLPGSQNLFSPRWSPDGHYIAALSLDQRQIQLYDVASQTWRGLLNRSAADPVWSADSKAIYADAFMDAGQPVYRVNIFNGHAEDMASMSKFRSDDVIDFVFAGLLPNDVVAVRARKASANLYSIDLLSVGPRRF